MNQIVAAQLRMGRKTALCMATKVSVEKPQGLPSLGFHDVESSIGSLNQSRV